MEEQEKKLSIGEIIASVIVFGLIAVFIVPMVWNELKMSESQGPAVSIVPSEQNTAKQYTDYDAYVNAQVILEKVLKSPSTAKYPTASDAIIKRYKDDAFEVSAYVDSQNSFGAMIRSNWTVMFKFVDDSVKPLAIVLDGEVLYKADSTD